jgi:hypothetical protein
MGSHLKHIGTCSYKASIQKQNIFTNSVNESEQQEGTFSLSNCRQESVGELNMLLLLLLLLQGATECPMDCTGAP